MAVEVGQKAPDLAIPDVERVVRSLKDFAGKKVVLAFYPGAFTPVCTRELCTFRDSLNRLEGLGAQVIGISVDTPFSNRAFAVQNHLNFPVLSDYNREVCRLYDVLLSDFAGLKGLTAAKRSVFVLDRDGFVRYKWVSDDPTKEPDYSEITRAVEQIA